MLRITRIVFLVLDNASTNDINASIGAAEKNLSINFSISKTKLCLIMQCNHDNSYLYFNRKAIYKFKADNKNINFPTQFSLVSISNKV